MNEPLKDLGFWSSYPSLYEKAARIQKECFPYSPEEKGALFYALEVCGEVGELLNVCKKIIRTSDREKASSLRLKAFPEEAADCAIALSMLSQAEGLMPRETEYAFPVEDGGFHPLLIALAESASGLYAAAWKNAVTAEGISSALSVLYALSRVMNCDLAGAVNEKLDKIAVRALEKHYD
jgi:NTP pyrophosphatase (non-canonical NTP hydrolase)